MQRHLSEECSSGLVCTPSVKLNSSRVKPKGSDKIKDRKVINLKTSSTKARIKSPATLRSPAKPPIHGIKPFLCLKGKPIKRVNMSPKKSVKDKVRDFESKTKDSKTSQEVKIVKEIKEESKVDKTNKTVHMKSDKIKRIAEMFEKDDASDNIDVDNKDIYTRIEGEKVMNAFEILMMTKGDTPTRKTPKIKRMKSSSTKKSDGLRWRK